MPRTSTPDGWAGEVEPEEQVIEMAARVADSATVRFLTDSGHRLPPCRHTQMAVTPHDRRASRFGLLNIEGQLSQHSREQRSVMAFDVARRVRFLLTKSVFDDHAIPLDEQSGLSHTVQ